MTAGQVLVSILVANGVDRVFSVPGESFLPVLDAFINSDIDVVTCHHESSAGFMALADARMTGKLGVCLVSRGPGATNAAIAVHTAEQDGLPLILFVGQVPCRLLGRGSFQEIDYSQMFGGIGKLVVEVTDASRMAELVSRAAHVALDGTPGPVVVSLPEDVLAELTSDAGARPITRTVTAPDGAVVARTAALLRQAKRPLIIAGGGLATAAGRNALLDAAERWSVPVAVSFRRHDLFPNDHELFAGDLSPSNTATQMETFRQADLIFAIGARLHDLPTHGYTFPASPYPEQPLIHVYNDPDVIGRHFRTEAGAACPPAAFLAALNEQSVGALPDRAGWIKQIAANTRAFTEWRAASAPDGVVFGNIIVALAAAVDRDAIIVPDAGMSGGLIYRYFPFRPPQLLMATIAGVMGFGVPGAVALAMRCPERQIVCIAGDGGFLMTGNELAIAVARKLKLAIFVAHNRSLGSIRANQEREFPHRVVGTDLTTPDFVRFAEAFGCRALLIDDESRIADTVSEALKSDGPVLVEVKTSLAAQLPK